MPFWHSNFLTDPKSKVIKASKSSSGTVKSSNATTSSAVSRPRLVWHSNTGSTGRKVVTKGGHDEKYKPLHYNKNGKRIKTVHFATVEVQPFRFDWTLADDVFYTRKELAEMGQSRFDDADILRKQRQLESTTQLTTAKEQAQDDVGTSIKSNEDLITDLLSQALTDKDSDPNVSIRGIEHFVYPDLQQEMIRRKRQVQREVMEFVRSKRPDPQGWRLADHSRQYSEWARNVAIQKGMNYCLNNAHSDPNYSCSKDELDRCRRSTDELDAHAKSLRPSASFPTVPTSSSITVKTSFADGDKDEWVPLGDNDNDNGEESIIQKSSSMEFKNFLQSKSGSGDNDTNGSNYTDIIVKTRFVMIDDDEMSSSNAGGVETTHSIDSTKSSLSSIMNILQPAGAGTEED